MNFSLKVLTSSSVTDEKTFSDEDDRGGNGLGLDQIEDAFLSFFEHFFEDEAVPRSHLVADEEPQLGGEGGGEGLEAA